VKKQYSAANAGIKYKEKKLMTDVSQPPVQTPSPDTTKIKKFLLIGGVIFIILGICFIIYAFIDLPGLTGATSPDMPAWPDDFNQSWQENQRRMNEMRNQSFSFNGINFGKMIFFPIGVFFIMIGFAMIYYSQLRRITSFVATETAPAMTTTTHAAGDGLMSGINEAGGIKINVAGSGATNEVIKIKCRNCGYHESIDAEYCSKCGNKI
jgi:hypothetical protein